MNNIIVMSRRKFVKYAMLVGGAVALGVGVSNMMNRNGMQISPTVAQTLNITITDALKDMVTHNTINNNQCYFWIYKVTADGTDIPAEVPGPHIITTQGETVNIMITNNLDEPHAFFIPGIFDSGSIDPGKTMNASFTAAKSGTFLYHDNLNEPVNRVMGLHGAFIVMPGVPQPGHKFTPFDSPTPAVQSLFDDLGTAAHWPGLAWEQGDPNQDSFTPAFRQYIWVLHEASPNLFAEVGKLPPGEIFPAKKFVDAFLRDPFSPVNATRTPQNFTIDGQSGHFSHDNSFICPTLRVGEPCVIRVLNAGLMAHSLHNHANHVFLISINGVVQANPFWVDTFTTKPMDIWEWLNPYMRPPDVPNFRGIGRADTPLPVDPTPIPGFGPEGRSTPQGVTTWPPVQELSMHLPTVGTKAGFVPVDVQLSPLCYPMHDHSEPTQTSQGGNYNLGQISGMNFTGDRNTPGGVTTFPNAPKIFGPNKTGLAAGPEGAEQEGER